MYEAHYFLLSPAPAHHQGSDDSDKIKSYSLPLHGITYGNRAFGMNCKISSVIVASCRYCITASKYSGWFADGNESLNRQWLLILQRCSPTMIRLFILPDNLFITDCAEIRVHPVEQSRLWSGHHGSAKRYEKAHLPRPFPRPIPSWNFRLIAAARLGAGKGGRISDEILKTFCDTLPLGSQSWICSPSIVCSGKTLCKHNYISFCVPGALGGTTTDVK